MGYGGWAPYVSVAERRAKAEKKMQALRKQGKKIEPIALTGRTIATTFWGRAWCEHLEKLSDFANRLPRGRSYVRNGSVCHLEILKSTIHAMVSGSSLYHVTICIKPLDQVKWQTLRTQCAGSIGSILELLQGKLSSQIMSVVTDRDSGLFPLADEIEMKCDCPDWATMCKHVAAVLYGVGARLDHAPELLFLLRGVQHEELITSDLKLPTSSSRKRQISGDLSALFDVELEQNVPPKTAKAAASTPTHPKSSERLLQKKTPVIPPAAITANTIRKLRKKLRMTPAEFASHIQVMPQTVKNWENKRGVLNLHTSKRKKIETLLLGNPIKLDDNG